MTAPKHPSVRARRNSAVSLRSLPAAGRVGPIPRWPLRPNPRLIAELEGARDRVAALQVDLAAAATSIAKARVQRRLMEKQVVVAALASQLEQADGEEIALWAELWRTPQAVLWEQSFASREVAQYVRWKIAAEQGDLRAAAEARQLSDRLGLNPLALIRLNLEIERADEAESRGAERRSRRKASSSPDPRNTLKLV